MIANNNTGLQLAEPITFSSVYCVVVPLKGAAGQFAVVRARSMDACSDSHRISVSLRNALTANSVKTHELSQTVKTLEAKRDHKLLNLQVQKDRVISSVPGKNKAVTKSSSGSPDSRVSTPQGDPATNQLLHKSARDSLSKKSSLPPLNIQPPGSPVTKLRRAATLQHEQPAPPGSPKPRRPGSVQSHFTLSPPCSPRQISPGRVFGRQLSSPSMLPNSMGGSLRDLSHSEEILECQQRFAPGCRSSVAGSLAPNITGGLAKFPNEQGRGNHFSGRPRTANEAPAENGVHRGLQLRPVSSSMTESKKSKEKPKTAVFSRLYSNVKEAGWKASAARRINSDGAAGKRLTARRRSLSMPDLSEMMENLKSCRYLRGADQKNSDDELGEDTAIDSVEN